MTGTDEMPKLNTESKWLFMMFAVILISGVIFYVMNKTTGIDDDGNPYKHNYTDDDEYEENLELDVNYKTGVMNSKILGLILIFVIGAFAVRLLAGNNNS